MSAKGSSEELHFLQVYPACNFKRQSSASGQQQIHVKAPLSQLYFRWSELLKTANLRPFLPSIYPLALLYYPLPHQIFDLLRAISMAHLNPAINNQDPFYGILIATHYCTLLMSLLLLMLLLLGLVDR